MHFYKLRENRLTTYFFDVVRSFMSVHFYVVNVNATVRLVFFVKFYAIVKNLFK